MKHKVNEIKISYQQRIPAKQWQSIHSSKDAAQYLYQHWDKDTLEIHETFKVVLLNNGNKVKGVYELAKGGLTTTPVDLRILFAVILKTLSVAIILSHNHPSGAPRSACV